MSHRKPKVIHLDAAEVMELVEVTEGVLDGKLHARLKAILETFLWVMTELEETNTISLYSTSKHPLSGLSNHCFAGRLRLPSENLPRRTELT